jgi:hypothetical protein
MDFLLLVLNRRGAEPPPTDRGEMTKFAHELGQQGVLRGGAPLRPESEGSRVYVRDGVARVLDGGALDAGHVLVGFLEIDVPDRAAALEIARRCPHARAGTVEVRRSYGRRMEGKGGPRFVHLYLWGPELTGPDEPRMAEMGQFMQWLAREGKIVSGARLPPDEPAARIEVRRGRALVTDGPFAECKELIAGFSVIEAASREESLEIAQRTPHAEWDHVIVREVEKETPWTTCS